MPLASAREEGLVVDLEPEADYFESTSRRWWISRVLARASKVVVDVLYGTGRVYLDAFLKEAGVEVELLNGYRDAYFGGHRPGSEFLQDLSAGQGHRGSPGPGGGRRR